MLAEAGYMSLGALIGTGWWLIFIFLVFKPELKELRSEITAEKDRIEQKIDEQLAKIPEIPDIDAKIEEIKAEFKTDDLFDGMMTELAKPMDQWKPEYREGIGNLLGGCMNVFMFNISNDEDGKPNNPVFNKVINDKMKGIAMNMKKEFRTELTEMVPEVANAMGIDPALIKQGADMFEMIPEEYRGWAQLFYGIMKGGGIPGMGGGGGATAPYTGF